MSAFPINPAGTIATLRERVAQLEQQNSLLHASNDVLRDLVAERTREVNRCDTLIDAVSREARDDTEKLHDQLDRSRAEVRRLTDLLRHSKYAAGTRKRTRVVYLDSDEQE